MTGVRPRVDESASGAADSVRPDPISLFVLWSAARHEEKRIVEDLDKHFTIVGMYDIRWSPARVRRNYERFYSDLDVRGVYHVHNKGSGGLLAIIVSDPQPVYEDRMTSRGVRFVNARYLDAKERYRSWTGDFAVHSAETAHELRRDVAMLIGIDCNDIRTLSPGTTPAEVEVLDRDPTGAGGWDSERQLFATLNCSVDYVVLAGATAIDSTAGRRSLRLLTEDSAQLLRILDAKHAFRTTVTIGGRTRRVEVREPGDRYIDPAWAQACLERRRFDVETDRYVLATEDAVALLAYESVVFRHTTSPEDIRTVESLIDAEPRPDRATSSSAIVRTHLEQFLDTNGYTYTTPRDPTVLVRLPGAGSWPRTRQTIGYLRRTVDLALLGTRRLLSTWYLEIRDWIVLRLPWIRRLRARVR